MENIEMEKAKIAGRVQVEIQLSTIRYNNAKPKSEAKICEYYYLEGLRKALQIINS